MCAGPCKIPDWVVDSCFVWPHWPSWGPVQEDWSVLSHNCIISKVLSFYPQHSQFFKFNISFSLTFLPKDVSFSLYFYSYHSLSDAKCFHLVFNNVFYYLLAFVVKKKLEFDGIE